MLSVLSIEKRERERERTREEERKKDYSNKHHTKFMINSHIFPVKKMLA